MGGKEIARTIGSGCCCGLTETRWRENVPLFGAIQLPMSAGAQSWRATASELQMYSVRTNKGLPKASTALEGERAPRRKKSAHSYSTTATLALLSGCRKLMEMLVFLPAHMPLQVWRRPSLWLRRTSKAHATLAEATAASSSTAGDAGQRMRDRRMGRGGQGSGRGVGGGGGGSDGDGEDGGHSKQRAAGPARGERRGDG